MPISPSIETCTVAFSYPGSSIPGLKVVAKRYRPTIDVLGAVDTGLTLILTHCVGSHKESWEPVIDVLFNLRVAKDSPAGEHVSVIREVWSFDWQQHGESATVNRNVLSANPPGVSILELEAALRHFVTAKSKDGHRIVGIGHSAGATAILRSTMCLPADVPMPYVAIIFVEDSLSSMEVWKKRGNDIRRNLDAMMSAIAKRRDTWANRQEAYDYFSSRAPWKTWDKRVLDLYVRHGLRDTLPSESDKSTVTLACDKSQEKATYADHDNEPYRGAARYLESLDPDFDIHCVYGEKEDFIRQASHDSILASRRMASVYRVPNAAHFVIQQNPQGVALCLGQILRDIVEGPLRPRL